MVDIDKDVIFAQSLRQSSAVHDVANRIVQAGDGDVPPGLAQPYNLLRQHVFAGRVEVVDRSADNNDVPQIGVVGERDLDSSPR